MTAVEVSAAAVGPDAAHAPPAEPAPAGTGRPPVAGLVAALLSCCGVCIVAVGYALARYGVAGNLAVFFLGYVATVAPPAWRLTGRPAGAPERLALSIVLTGALFAGYACFDLTRFLNFDEFIHDTSLRSLAVTGHAFGPNPLLPVSTYFPGLELAVHGLSQITGLSGHAAALVLLGALRVLLTLALFSLALTVCRSARAAGWAVAIYAAGPQFWFFNAQFAYQSMAVPLLLAVLALTVRGCRAAGATRAVLLGVAAAACLAVAVTHHLTSYFLCAALLALTVLERVRRVRPAGRMGALYLVTAAAVVSVGGWTIAARHQVLPYLAPEPRLLAREIAGVLDGSGGGKSVGHDQSGTANPAWEMAFLLASMAIPCLCLPPALWFGLRSRLADAGLVRLLVLTAAAFPVLLLGQLTAAGAEVNARSSTFTFVALAVLGGLWLVRPGRPSRSRHVLEWSTLLVVALGGLIAGSGPDWSRVPGPYLVSANVRSVDALQDAAAGFQGQRFPAGTRVAADRFGGVELASLGLHPVTDIADRVDISDLYYPNAWSPALDAELSADRVRSVEVDQRLADGPPRDGVYFESGEQGSAGTVARRLTVEGLAKFADLPRLSQVYDNGPIKVYEVR